MALVTICGDFGAQENKVCHCFHCFSVCLPWSDQPVARVLPLGHDSILAKYERQCLALGYDIVSDLTGKSSPPWLDLGSVQSLGHT